MYRAPQTTLHANEPLSLLVADGRATARATGKRTWNGFAAVPQAVLERLLGEDDVGAADARASLQPRAQTIADARHVVGFECPAVPDTIAHEAARVIADMRRRLHTAGGDASRLAHEQLESAEAYLRADRDARAQMDDSYFSAWLRVVAADLDKLELNICVSGTDDEREEKRARTELAAIMAEGVVLAGECTAQARARWRDAAADEVHWRDAQERERGFMHVVLRAWRDACETARDTTAASAWQQQRRRLPRPEQPRLPIGARLSFGARAANLHVTGHAVVGRKRALADCLPSHDARRATSPMQPHNPAVATAVAGPTAVAGDGDAQFVAGEVHNNSQHHDDVQEVAAASSSEQAAQASASQKNSTPLHPVRDTANDTPPEVSEGDESDSGPGDDAARAPRRVRTDRMLILRPLARRRMWTWIGKTALKDGRLVDAQQPFGDG